MTKVRASIFEEPDELDVSGFAPKGAPDINAPAPEKVRAVAEAAHFSSRNVQLNINAAQAAGDAFYAIRDSNLWVLGETFERAIQALQRELQSK